MHTSASPARAATSHEAAFIDSLPLIRDVIRAVSRRCRVSHDEEAELASSVVLKLMSNDYQVFRQFRGGDGARRTFLFAVVYRHLLDRRNAEWGRWRPSRRARVLGSAAVHLETLVYRDGTHYGDAVALVANTPRWGLTSRAVRSLFARLPARPPACRRNEPLDLVAEHAADPAVDAVEHDEHRREAARARAALADGLQRLAPDERRLLRLRFQEGRTVREIAASTGTEASVLYRRFAGILKHLRADLQAQWFTDETIRSLLGHAVDEFDALLVRMCASQTSASVARSSRPTS